MLRATSLLGVLLLCTSVLATDVWATEVLPPAEVSPTDTQALVTATTTAARNEQIEKELQGLSWKQFRAVIDAIPKLKADVDAYGALGWSYVQARYQRYGWRKNLARLDDAEIEQLVGLITSARSIRD